MLEQLSHGDSCFLTLTYREENLPLCASGRSSLAPEDVRGFLKRIREALRVSPEIKFGGQKKLRFYLVGEYGEVGERPHYHLALFGVRCARNETLRRLPSSRPLWEECCPVCNLVGKTWGKGDVDLRNLEYGSAQYLAGYITKDMRRYDDPRLDGRHPEFARMSLRPGLGYDALWEVANTLMSYGLDESRADVPRGLSHGKRELPLGRYLRSNLRRMVGKDGKAPPEALAEIAQELLGVYLDSVTSKDNPSFKSHLVKAGDQAAGAMINRSRIYSQRKKL